MAQAAQTVTPIKIRYGHTDTHVLVVLSQPLEQIGLAPAEVDAMVTQLQATKAMLLEHQAEQARKKN